MSTDVAGATGPEAECRHAESAGYQVTRAELCASHGTTLSAALEATALEPPAARAAFGLGIAAGVIDGLRDAVASSAAEGLAFAVAELTFDYMAARELVAAASTSLSEFDTECAGVAVSELLRSCTTECLALGDRTPELARLRQLLVNSDVRALVARGEASLDRTAEIVLGRPDVLSRIAQDGR